MSLSAVTWTKKTLDPDLERAKLMEVTYDHLSKKPQRCVMIEAKDPYSVLNIAKGSSIETCRQAYEKAYQQTAQSKPNPYSFHRPPKVQQTRAQMPEPTNKP